MSAAGLIATNGVVRVSVKSLQTILIKGLKIFKKLSTCSGGCDILALPQRRST
jgi:hypothetical protein